MQMLEHIHVNVDSITKTEEFMAIALPEFTRRGGDVERISESGEDLNGWAHIGNSTCYIALTERAGAESMKDLRHIGVVVDDVEALMSRLSAAGYEPADDSALDSHPHRRRVYYIDGNGLDWEFIEYLSARDEERNDYSL